MRNWYFVRSCHCDSLFGIIIYTVIQDVASYIGRSSRWLRPQPKVVDSGVPVQCQKKKVLSQGPVVDKGAYKFT